MEIVAQCETKKEEDKIRNVVDEVFFSNKPQREWRVENIEEIKHRSGKDYLVSVSSSNDLDLRLWISGDFTEVIWIALPSGELLPKIRGETCRTDFDCTEALILWMYDIEAEGPIIRSEDYCLFAREYKLAAKSRDGYRLVTSDSHDFEKYVPKKAIYVSFSALFEIESFPQDLMVLELKGHEALFRDVVNDKIIFKGYDETLNVYRGLEGAINSSLQREFIVELDASSIEEAKEKLKPKEVIEAELKGKEVKRQGDMFFIHSKANYKGHTRVIAKRDQNGHLFYCPVEVNLAMNEYPNSDVEQMKLNSVYVADLMNRHTPEYFVVDYDKVFVKGEIKHPEHRKLTLNNWHRVTKSPYTGIHPRGDNGINRID